MRALIINFNLKNLSVEDFKAQAHIDAMIFRNVAGLISKYFIGDDDKNIYGGIYIFKDSESLENYKNGGIFNFLANHENFENFKTHEHDLIDGPSIIAGGNSIPMA